jgi:hypothetical protein
MFWLYQWMDDRGVTSTVKAEKLLRRPKELTELHERAAAVRYTTEPLDDSDCRHALLGGRGVTCQAIWTASAGSVGSFKLMGCCRGSGTTSTA